MIIQSAPVITKGPINMCGWIIIATTGILITIGIILLGVGYSKAAGCTTTENSCYATGGSYYNNTCYDAYVNCVAAAVETIIAGYVILVIGLIFSCISCCAMCGSSFRTQIVTGGGATVVGMHPQGMMMPQQGMMQPGMMQQQPMYDPNQQQMMMQQQQMQQQQMQQQPQQPQYTQ